MSELRHLVDAVTGASSSADRLEAERELCIRLAPRIQHYGLRHLRDEAASADLVQEALIVLLEAARAGAIEEPEHADRFVLGICRNLVSRSRRNERRAKAFEGKVLPLEGVELPPAFMSIDRARLALCLGKIGSREQSVVLLTFLEDRNADEIASKLGTTAGNVRVLRHRAINALHRCVEGVAS